MRTSLAVLAAVFTLVGCAGFLPPQHDMRLSTLSSCCASVSALPFRDIGKGDTVRTLVGPDTPAFAFPDGKSYFLALRLKIEHGGAKLIVRTFPQNMLYNRDGHVFVPRMTFLSIDHKVIDSVSPEFTVQKPRLGVGESSWRVDLPVPVQARYVVIHTTSTERSRTLAMRDSDQRGGYLYTRSGPAGEIEVELH